MRRKAHPSIPTNFVFNAAVHAHFAPDDIEKYVRQLRTPP